MNFLCILCIYLYEKRGVICFGPALGPLLKNIFFGLEGYSIKSNS